MIMTATVRSRHPAPSRDIGGSRRLNRSRSGEGLQLLRKGKRPATTSPSLGRSTSCIAIVIVALALFVLITVTLALQFTESHPNSVGIMPLVRRRQQELVVDRNADDVVPDAVKDAVAADSQEKPQSEQSSDSSEEEQIYDGGRYQGEVPVDGDEKDVEEVAIEDVREDLEASPSEDAKDQQEHSIDQDDPGRNEQPAPDGTEKTDQIVEAQQLNEVAIENQETNNEEPKHQQEQPIGQEQEQPKPKIETGTDQRPRHREKPPRVVEPPPTLPPEGDEPNHQSNRADPLSQQEPKHVQPRFSFCDFMRKKVGSFSSDVASNRGYANPAVLVLGMEDLTTDLVWHVIAQLLYPNRPTTPKRTEQLTHHATAIDYSLLDKPSEDFQAGFWRKVSDKSKGKWMVHVFCQQQEHDLAMGFPWLTSPGDMTSKNHKAHDTLNLIKTMPKGSVKIIRVKRNTLDTAIREAQRNIIASANENLNDNARDHTHKHHQKELIKVNLDHKKIFFQLHNLQAEQKAVDDFLENHAIPHLTIDFESLFPFWQWTELVELAQQAQNGGNFLNTDDFESLSAAPLEVAWRDVLKFLNIVKPLTLFDILQATLRTHKVNTFWSQKDAVENWPYIDQALQGTHYQQCLRKEHVQVALRQQQQEEQHDRWGEGDEM